MEDSVGELNEEYLIEKISITEISNVFEEVKYGGKNLDSFALYEL